MAREKRLYFRRCHVCGDVTNAQSPVQHCENCGKPIATYCYFNEQDVIIPCDDKERPRYKDAQVIPIVGLSAYWGVF